MRILVAPDKFKGSLSAAEAASAIARGFLKVWPDAQIDLAPIADGGEGFAEALAVALQASWASVRSTDALGGAVEARYAWADGGKLAIIEMSEASGLRRLKADARDPLRADTFGTGLLLADAIRLGAGRVLVGLGGSATTDGGVGVARALGYRFFDTAGGEYQPAPGTLESLGRIEKPANLRLPRIVAACDVQNPLLGSRGTARVYAAQKGADASCIERLERAMRRLADVCASSLGKDCREVPGAGAAGGLGFGLLTFCDATIEPGFDIVAETIHLDARIAAADLVVTGEGRLDDQTLEGKGPAGVAMRARKARKRVIGFGGSVSDAVERAGLFDVVRPITAPEMPLADAMRNAAGLLEQASRRAALELAKAP
jgi:glycerate kinase